MAFNIRKNSILKKCIGHYSPEQITVWTEGSASEKFEDMVENHFYLAIIDDTTVATGMVNTENGMIDAIFVEPKYMGLGVAKTIITHLEKLAKESGVAELKLDSTLNAASFYRACGFRGDKISTYVSPKGISLDCIPMTKGIASLYRSDQP